MKHIFSKCKTCKRRMQQVLTSYNIPCGCKTVEVVNVPAYQCPICGEIVENDLAYENAKRYANTCSKKTIDYSEYEDNENTNLVIISQMLW